MQGYFSEATPTQKIHLLRKACEAHTKLTKECAKGLGQDRYASSQLCEASLMDSPSRHLYALYCLLQREINEGSIDGYKSGGSGASTPTSSSGHFKPSLPEIFTDHGWTVLNTSILSTSNCGNPALRLFGFGPVAADGFGIGYIIKDDGISVYVISFAFDIDIDFFHIAARHQSICRPDDISTLFRTICWTFRASYSKSTGKLTRDRNPSSITLVL